MKSLESNSSASNSPFRLGAIGAAALSALFAFVSTEKAQAQDAELMDDIVLKADFLVGPEIQQKQPSVDPGPSDSRSPNAPKDPRSSTRIEMKGLLRREGNSMQLVDDRGRELSIEQARTEARRNSRLFEPTSGYRSSSFEPGISFKF